MPERASVGTKEQTENLSLPTQLRACEEYCPPQGYEVLERFHEEGESAKTGPQPASKLLTYCRLNKGRIHFVVVFNLTRFARAPPSPCGLRRAGQITTISRSAPCCSRSASRRGPRRNRSMTRPPGSSESDPAPSSRHRRWFWSSSWRPPPARASPPSVAQNRVQFAITSGCRCSECRFVDERSWQNPTSSIERQVMCRRSTVGAELTLGRYDGHLRVSGERAR